MSTQFRLGMMNIALKGLDTWTQRLHAEAFADGPPCADCHCDDEVHTEDGQCTGCGNCEGYRPDDPRDHAPDEPYEEDD